MTSITRQFYNKKQEMQSLACFKKNVRNRLYNKMEPKKTHCACSSVCQGLLHIVNNIVNVLDPNGETDQAGADAGIRQLLIGHLPVGGGSRMQNDGSQISHMNGHRRKL